MPALATKPVVRDVIYTTRGHSRGPITRLVSPSDLGEVIKPFVFLDLVNFDGASSPIKMEQFWHPHSGIATITVPLDGAIRIADTTGADIVLPAGGIEWMRAGHGVWHTGEVVPGRMRGFQLWIALPPELELAASESAYVQPEQVRSAGPARVILGEYEGVHGPIAAPDGMTYLAVELAAGEAWRYTPPPGHEVAWIAIADGVLHAPAVEPGAVAVFRPGTAPIDFVAAARTRFVLGSAIPHPHELFLGNYSVHTSAQALRDGEAEIVRIGRALEANGTLRYARPAVSL